MTIRNYNLNSNNDIKNYSADDISRYWQGKLTSEEMHAMERAAMDDPFLADAMEGYSTANPQTVSNDLAELRERLQEKSSGARAVPMYRRWWRIAAVIILLGGASFLTYQLLDRNKTADNLVQATEEKAPAANETAQLKDSSGPIQNQTVVADTLVANADYLSPTVDGNTSARKMTLPKAGNDKFAASITKSGAPVVPDLSAYKKPADTVGNLMNVAKEDFRRDSAVVAKTESERSARTQDNVYRSNVPTSQAPANRDETRNYYLNNFSGRVMDNERNAIPQASLRVNNNNQVAVTDNNGYFNIRSGDSLLDLSVASAGYQSRNLTLRSNQPSDVVLDPIPQKKSSKEGYATNTEMKKVSGAKSKVDDKSLKGYPMEAEPVIGWDQYNKYLLTNNRLLKDTVAATTIEVVVLFTVSRNGKLSSFDIAKSGGKELDAEAIRLVKNGPEWRVLKDRKTKARVIVTFPKYAGSQW